MSAFRTMVDMAKTPQEKAEDMAEASAPTALMQPDYPYGLCICLTQDELDKLGLDSDCCVGDMVHLFAMASVTSVSKRDNGAGPECRIELQITHLEVEDEDEENEENEEAEGEPVAARAGRLYGNGAAEADDGD